MHHSDRGRRSPTIKLNGGADMRNLLLFHNVLVLTYGRASKIVVEKASFFLSNCSAFFFCWRSAYRWQTRTYPTGRCDLRRYRRGASGRNEVVELELQGQVGPTMRTSRSPADEVRSVQGEGWLRMRLSGASNGVRPGTEPRVRDRPRMRSGWGGRATKGDPVAMRKGWVLFATLSVPLWQLCYVLLYAKTKKDVVPTRWSLPLYFLAPTM